MHRSVLLLPKVSDKQARSGPEQLLSLSLSLSLSLPGLTTRPVDSTVWCTDVRSLLELRARQKKNVAKETLARSLAVVRERKKQNCVS